MFMEFYNGCNHFVASGVPVYMYEFSYDGTLNLFKKIVRSGMVELNFQITGTYLKIYNYVNFLLRILM